MWFLFSLTLLSIFIKIFIFTKLLGEKSTSIVFKLIFLITCCSLFQSFIEVIGYFFIESFSRQSLLLALKLYYASLILAIFALPFIALELTQKKINIYFLFIAIAMMSSVLLLLLFTDLIIVDIQIIAYTGTRVAGEYYWVFQVLALMAMAFTLTTLFLTLRKTKNNFIYGRAANMIIAFLPLCLFTFLVVVAMHLGYQVNAVGFLPIFISAFLGMIAWNLVAKNPPDFSFLIPGSPKQRLMYKLFLKVCRLETEKQPINPEAYQNLLVKYAVEVSNGNQREAAKLLNTSPSTVSRMLRKTTDND